MDDETVLDGFVNYIIGRKPILDQICAQTGVRLVEVRLSEKDGEDDIIYRFMGKVESRQDTTNRIKRFLEKHPS